MGHTSFHPCWPPNTVPSGARVPGQGHARRAQPFARLSRRSCTYTRSGGRPASLPPSGSRRPAKPTSAPWGVASGPLSLGFWKHRPLCAAAQGAPGGTPGHQVAEDVPHAREGSPRTNGAAFPSGREPKGTLAVVPSAPAMPARRGNAAQNGVGGGRPAEGVRASRAGCRGARRLPRKNTGDPGTGSMLRPPGAAPQGPPTIWDGHAGA